MRKLILLFFSYLVFVWANANEYKVDGIYPSNWWVGMKNPKVQLMVHGSNISENTFTINYPGVKLVKVNKVENPNYVFLDLTIAPLAKPGQLKIHINGFNGDGDISFELKQRRKGKGTLYAQGVTSNDFIYLLMPDRFSNGDYSNDKVPGMKDQSLNRDSLYHRHGGDLKGVINHLDYLQDLGVTTLWMTPVLENDMPNRTEHGYAITNHYKVDPRLGGNDVYKRLSDELHKRGMKLIQDAVYNHTGLQHFFVQDLPMKDWLNQWPKYTNTTYKDQPLMDSYASIKDREVMSNGWFTPQMPDLNQNNPYVANFLIQHAIWSVEEFGVDGWRIDTYIYNDLPFMNRCNKALMDEYPKITLFGETWVHGMLDQAFFTQNNMGNIPFKSNLPGVTDFQTNLYGINPALTQNFGWTEGVNKLYQTLANDFIYVDPMKNVTFLDNHDMTRFLSQVGEDIDKLKMGIGWLFTTRGIPQLYYGTEILMKGVSNPDGWVRLDFQGGWKEDAQNKFTKEGRTEQENEVFNWTKTLANFRKRSSALKTGKLMQYVPEDWVYTYFRYDNNQTVMVIMNTATEEKTIDVSRFSEQTNGFRKAVNVVTSSSNEFSNIKWIIPAKTLWVLNLEK
ncbi:glycoside hydrolase family 13 protein [Chitinophagaceae bacterium LB-8]|uniref:Glycoside hydrolase family 13 protein n=1 Tax=Paraflavisolibacter caeni TaxID=2982496 RepID=A0A9X3B922_9BACT|nr:glycoside hydrolase family 13 protein [Paraflavisolibacter caeni]MCU7551555.1 glycoside hydrolase family 13 protein [Paraflavisolibacter caeni]